MRFREAVREGHRDVVSGVAGAGVLAIVFGVLLGGVVGVRATGVVAEVRAAHAFVAAGAATTVVEATARIDGRACDALVDIPSVRAAGALRSLEEGTAPIALPRSMLPTREVTNGFSALLERGAPTGSSGPGVLASVELADELGLRAGDTLETASGAVPVDAVYAYPDDGRDPDLAYALLAPSIDDGRPFDACWATIWPLDESAVAAVRRTVLPPTGSEGEERVTSGQLNPRLGTAPVSGPTLLGARETVLVAFGAGGVLGWAALMRRRLAIASDRHVGVTVRAQVVSVLVQHGSWSIVGGVAALAGGAVLVRGFDAADALPVLVEAGTGVVLGVVGAALGGVVGLLSVRERSLHRYFRRR